MIENSTPLHNEKISFKMTSAKFTFIWLIFVSQLADVDSTFLKFHNNRYDDLVVAISPDIKEDTTIITKIQDMVNDASPYLYGATRKRAYFGNVKILVPETWNPIPSSQLATVETFEKADVRIDKPSPLYGIAPYTFQPEGCGDPGKYIHLSEGFILDAKRENELNFGPTGRLLVHEFSHLRYGVFDEYGLGTKDFPYFYLDGGVVKPVGCTENIRGSFTGDSVCDVLDPATRLPSPPPGKQCLFLANREQNTAKASIMNDFSIKSVITFCESKTNDSDLKHNSHATNQQNTICNNKGTWDVIKEHADFKGANPSVTKSEAELKPSFTILYAGKATALSGGKDQDVCGRPVVLVLDVSGSMAGDRIFKQQQTSDKLIKDILPMGTKLGIVRFSDDAYELFHLTPLMTSADRIRASRNVPSRTIGGTSIGSGLRLAVQMLNKAGIRTGGRIVLITDGEENEAPSVASVTSEIKNSGITVHAVAYSSAASKAIRALTVDTGGQYFYYSENAASTVLDSAMEEMKKDISICSGIDRQQIFRTAETLKVSGKVQGTVTIDPTLRNDTMFVFTLPQGVTVTVTLEAPDRHEYNSLSSEYSLDRALNIIRFNFPVAEIGVWTYSLESSSSGKVTVVVKALPGGEDPYEINSWISSSLADSSKPAEKPVIVYVHVHKGYSPLINADVTVKVERPSGSPIKLTPADNGLFADTMADDGVYSAYFLQYTTNQRYSFDVVVRSIGKAAFIVSKNGTMRYGGAQSRLHNTSPSVVLQTADNFTRTTSPGAMDVKGFQNGKDNFPPSRVTDLKVVAFDSEKRTVTVTWTAPGDDLNIGTASNYDIRMAQSAQELVSDFNKCKIVNLNMVTSGSLQPKAANTKERITIKTPAGWTTIVFALKARDEINHSSDKSNIATATFKQVKIAGLTTVTPTVKPVEGNPRPKTDDGSNTAIIIAIVGGILGGFVILGVVIIVVMRLQGGKNVIHLPENPLEAQMTESTVAVSNSHYVKM